MGKVYYVGTYSGDADRLRRKNIRMNPAGTSKMDYILHTLKELKRPVTLVEIAPGKDSGFCREELVEDAPLQRRVCLSSLVLRILGKNIVRGDLSRFFLKRFILKNVTKEDTVLVYHSLLYDGLIKKLHKRIGFRLILEVEEVYQDVVSCSRWEAARELDAIRDADGYIFSTSKLNEKLNLSGKPFVIVNGTYLSRPVYTDSFGDGRCHCVYAGTLEPSKGSGLAVDAGRYLDGHYAVHILGHGTDVEVRQLKERIAAVQSCTDCALSYDGLMSGEAYERFLQKCSVGFCTQIPDSKYIETSFPSKVLVYLANGLQVVCGRFAAVETSEIGKCLHYYDEQTPQSVAEVVMRIDTAHCRDSRKLLDELNTKFQHDFCDLIKER